MIFTLLSLFLSAIGAASALLLLHYGNEPLGLVIGFAATCFSFIAMLYGGLRS